MHGNAFAVVYRKPMVYAFGPDMLGNGGFLTDTVWTKGLGWTIANGAATINGLGLPSLLRQAVAVPVAALYRVDMVVASVAAPSVSVNLMLLGSPILTLMTVSTVGTHSALVPVLVAGDGLSITSTGSASMSIDSISLKKVL